MSPDAGRDGEAPFRRDPSRGGAARPARPGELPPGLSMLWEQVDAQDALASRFGFDGLPGAVDWLRSVLGAVWGFDMLVCERLVISDRNAIAWTACADGARVVKWSARGERFAPLAAQAALLREIDRQGVPVAAPLDTLDGRSRVVVAGPGCPLSVAVTPEVRGDWLDIRDPRAVRNAGACLARLHAALRSSPRSVALETPDRGPLPERIAAWLETEDRGFVPEASRRLAELVAVAPPLGGHRQLVHNDFRAANILMRDARVTAVLDFDEMEYAPPVADLARSGVLLGTRFTSWAPTPVAARGALLEGYESVRPLEAEERDWLVILTLWAGIQSVPGEGAADPQDWAAAVRP